MKARKSPGADKGFTLIELVLAVTILAMIVGVVAAGLRLASVSIDRGEETAREAARLRAAIRLIERSIRSADTLAISMEDKKELFFVGENRRLRFLTAQPTGSTGLRLMSLHEVPGPGGGLAVSTASPFQAGGGIWDGIEESRILVPGADDVAFSYSPGPDGNGSWEWLPFWDSKEYSGLPMAVRVEFVVHAGDGPRKTSFVAPVMVVAGVSR